MERTRPCTTSPSRIGALSVAVALLAALLLSAPGPAGAAVAFKSGSYSGKTTQTSVTASFRKVEFRLSKKES
jgi:hypothetical protein